MKISTKYAMGMPSTDEFLQKDCRKYKIPLKEALKSPKY
jgi:hypothetical protein